MITYYSRPVGAGAGRQNIFVKDGVIVKQYLVARSGYYTGAGNLALLGQPESRLSKLGFRRVPGPQVLTCTETVGSVLKSMKSMMNLNRTKNA